MVFLHGQEVVASIETPVTEVSSSEHGLKEVSSGEAHVLEVFSSIPALEEDRHAHPAAECALRWDNVSISSWFSQISLASMDFVTESRIAWVELEGIPFKLWSEKTFKRIASKWGEMLDTVRIRDDCFHSKRICVQTKCHKWISEEFKIIFRGKVFWIRAKETPGWVPDFTDEEDENEISDTESKDELKVDDQVIGIHREEEDVPETLFEEGEVIKDQSDANNRGDQEIPSEDPLNIYELLNKKDTDANIQETEFSAKYPPGFTPKEDSANNSANCGTAKVENNMETNKDADTNEFCVNQSESNLKEDGAESTFSGYFKKSKGPRSGGSILNLLEDVVKVGHVMGYNMEGCVSNMEEIIKSQGAGEVNILALQETKMENMSLLCVKSCWGNMTFDFVHSDSVGNSGGILCVWDPNAFRKNSVTLSDYFILVRGVWEQNGMDLLIVVVYAPHDAKEKIMLWDYLASEINRWRGKVVVMVELGGCSFTWCHKTAKKMSKLDRFLVSDNLLHTYPHLSAISLERFLSDHRPILLREHHLDYGPTPFRFFHYWCEIDGFKNLVEDAWKDSPNNEGNAMLNLMGKFKFLKTKIRIWNKTNMANQKNVKSKLITDLESVEAEIDRGMGNEEIVAKRMNLVKNLQDINNLNSMEMAQKSNVKWAVEGDENSSFFHGTINKKRNVLAVRGIMIDGLWIDDPSLVKTEFLHHFSHRFAKPDCSRATLHSNFPNRLTSSQQSDLERDVSKDEIKRAVWDCGTDKSPGPDGFTFGFYRRFWYLIENDVYKVVLYFFLFGDIPKVCNSSFIVLIPKFPGANMFDHEVQSAFVKDRQILDCPFILDELIQWCKKKRKHLLVFKVDFEKAFDSVRWDFLDDLLFKFGFGGKWRKWIQSCLRSSRGSIILNGSPTEEFQFHKGLKQGDPLSPLL
ncbi:RNA-directed DNA polymerase, eukaryota [Tanacetum coccineum]